MSRSTLTLLLLAALGIASLGAATYLLLSRGDGRSQAAQSEAAAVSPTQPAAADATLTPFPTAVPLATATETTALVTVTIQDGEETRTLQTEAPTVGDLLAEAGIPLGENDIVTPPAETQLVENMQLQITRVIPLTIQVDGQTYAVFSDARTPNQVLANAGITLGELDILNTAPDHALNAGDTIQVIRVREETIVVDEEVPFQTLYQPSDELDLDSKAVISSGAPGIKRQSTRIRYEDGVEVSREYEGEWMEREPVNEVIGYGTRITTNIIDTPEGPREYWRVVNMRVTAYTAASSGKPPDHPAYGITASGLPAGTGIVAVDPNVIPFRSEVFVPGYGIGFAGDTGGGVKGRWINLGYDEDELQAWSSYVDVYYLTPIPAEINYLIPEVLP